MKNRSIRIGNLIQIRRAAVAAVFLLAACALANGQVRPTYDEGAPGLAQAMKRLTTSASVLMIGAHPDDEDTALLAYLARGEGARTGYLSLTRGDGGQNIIGPQLGEALGVIRTEELLQARRLDGAEQYFTRAYDFGYSKTLSEARQKWDEQVILCDAVRIIREFRPLVVVSTYTGTPADGHGQHQFAGYISPLAVSAAADGGRCRGSGPTWSVKKFYVRHRDSGEPTLRINTGTFDPILGRSYFEIAMQARSQHRTQEQGTLELKGEQFSAEDLVGSTAKEANIFDSLDVTVDGIATNTGNVDPDFRNKLNRLRTVVTAASTQLELRAPQTIVTRLMDAYQIVDDLARTTGNSASRFYVEQKRRELWTAIKLAAGIQVDALSDAETVVPGEQFAVKVNLFAAVRDAVKVLGAGLAAPGGERFVPVEPLPEVGTGQQRREKPVFAAYFRPRITEASPSQPYWLESPRDGDLFKWPDAPFVSLPFQPPLLTAELNLSIDGRPIKISAPVEYRFADEVLGEVRRDLNVVPPLTVELDQRLIIVPKKNQMQTRRVVVSVVNNSPDGQVGEVSLFFGGTGRLAGKKSFDLTRRGQKVSLEFDFTIPADVGSGGYELSAAARTTAKTEGGTKEYASTMNVVAYPHIRTHRFYTPSKATVRVMDLAVAPVRVGYVAGTGDGVAEAIRRIGLPIEMLSESDLAASDLSRFDVIVIGIRAYEARPDTAANNGRLLDFAKNGGTLVVQYQLPAYAAQGMPPYPAKMSPRVADENASVSILEPGNTLFNFPNKITDDDFDGWVQERNLYNFSEFDPRYNGLLESHDAGESPNSGGLVIADIGRGKYVYLSYSMFRQLPAGVPGAYRLFANILSLGAKGK